jgi:glycerophosphoryl diester phosphodiesterase
MILTASRALGGKETSAAAGLSLLLRNLPGLVGIGLCQLSLAVLAAVPFVLLIGLVYFGFISEHDINFYLATKPPEFWMAVALAVPLVTGAALCWAVIYVACTFSVPLALFEGKRRFHALRSSYHRVKGRFRRTALIVLGWPAAASLVGAVLGGLAYGGAAFILARIPENLTLAVVLVGTFLAASVIGSLLFSFLVESIEGSIIARLYTGVSKSEPAQTAAATDSWTRSRRLPWAVAVLALIITTAASATLIDESIFKDHTLVTAHRGSSRAAPENTLSAVQKAIDDGADYAEIDVQETADGVVVVLHDTDLMRMTGVPKKIWEIRYEELRSLDAGSWFSEEFKGERIPTLEEVITLAGDDIKLNIELKFNGREENLVERTLDVIRENDFESRSIITSLSYVGIREAKRQNPALKVGHIVYQSLGNLARTEADFLSVSRQLATRNLIASAQSKGKQVHVWTINDPRQMSLMIDRGVDNIITDLPGELVALLEERSHLTVVERFLLRVRAFLAS